MICIEIPGRDVLQIRHILLDYNGTIAVDGALAPGAAESIRQLAQRAHVAVLTADTYGSAHAQCDPLGVEVVTFPRADAAQFKRQYASGLQGQVVSLGNGFNDVGMFDEADLSIAILDAEGAYAGLIAHADVLVRSIGEGLELLLKPDRLRATLRT